ncbi:MAG TPA: HAMP domain-containing sensor histidine kinase [Gaiellaceae bacterium]|nr:HAMP domain-containing sensor histidine kinase [Gaiellaceae bacterium]
MSLRTRLFVAIAAVAALSVAVAFGVGAYLSRRAVERNTLRDVAAQADLLAERERVSLLPFRGLRSLRPFLARQGERVVKAPLDGSSPYLPADRAAELRRGTSLGGTVTVDGTRFFYAARLVGGKALILLRPTDLVASSWRPHVRALLIGAAAAALLAAAAAFLLARAVARPVVRVAHASRRLADGEAPRVPVEGARELRLLAESFNETSVQLARAREAERSFLLSVSHELKTPLTAIRGYAEGLAEDAVPVEEAAETIALEASRLERLVGDLLDLGRLNRSEFGIRRELVDLAVAAREAVRRYEPAASAFGVELEAVADGTAPAVGDGDRILQVASNLVENALRLTPPGGSVRVVAEPGLLAVEDTGPGLRPEELPRAFERFYLHERYGRERPVGTGLGLAIVQQLAEGMGGSVSAASDPGRLTRFELRLPVAAGAPADGPLVSA